MSRGSEPTCEGKGSTLMLFWVRNRVAQSQILLAPIQIVLFICYITTKTDQYCKYTTIRKIRRKQGGSVLS